MFWKCASVRSLILEIAQGNATLLSLVKSLGEYLTSEEDDLRTKGRYSTIPFGHGVFNILQYQVLNFFPWSSQNVLRRS